MMTAAAARKMVQKALETKAFYITKAMNAIDAEINRMVINDTEPKFYAEVVIGIEACNSLNELQMRLTDLGYVATVAPEPNGVGGKCYRIHVEFYPKKD